jgi:hypothetical protein
VPESFSSSVRSRLCFRLDLLLIAAFLISAGAAPASVVFNWPNGGWTAGAPTGGQTKTQSFTSVSPNDITVSINNSGAGPSGETWNSGYPQISASPNTGGLSSTNGLQLYVTSSPALTAYIKVTVSFATPVTNLSFQLWDIDKSAGQFADKIFNLQALTQGGSTVGADTVSSAVSGYNSITGTGLSNVILGTNNASNTTNQGTINVGFNGPITQFSFQWSNNDSGLGAQAVSLGPLTYTPISESNASLLYSAPCFAALAVDLIRRNRKRC